ncbi:MAG: hypothetical protein H6Q25_1450 [Bacteroidetes bacterium]|nr:hypothetical protein [Bacteroidota bacterium]
MAKSKKSNPAQQYLSPENYIKTKGRTLPLHECIINTDWNERKMANIVISRKHTNGNVTYCVYLIDLLCVGVKTTYFGFNVEMDEYNEMINQLKSDLECESIDYLLAHNIIYGAACFAGMFEILPHKDFIKTTQYFLEEDTDDIELIDVDFGRKQIPFFVANDFYTKAQANIIIQKLEKVLGKGNADYVFGDIDLKDLNDDIEEFDDIDDAEVDDLEEDKRYSFFKSLKPNERSELFKTMASQEELNPSDESLIDLIKLANTILYLDLCDEKVIDSFLYKWDKEFNLPIEEENILELVGNHSPLDKKLIKLIPKLSKQIASGSQKANVKLKKELQEYFDNPYLCFIYLRLVENEENKTEYKQKLSTFTSLFPNYPMFKMENLKNRKMEGEKITAKDILPQIIFNGQESVTTSEMFQYLTLKMSVECTPKSFNVLQALEVWALEKPIGEIHQTQFLFYVQMFKIEYLKHHFNMKFDS